MATSVPHPGDPLRVLVRECLEDVDELVETYVAQVAGFSGYAGRVTPEDLAETARASFELLLRMIGDLPVPDRLRQVSAELGRRRVHAGVPLEELLRAVRMDFVVLWSALLARVDDADLLALTAGAVRVWDAVEHHTVQTHIGYLDELAVLARAHERERSLLVGRLLSSDGTDRHLVAQVATSMSAGAASAFGVAVARPEAEHALMAAAAARPRPGVHHIQQHDGAIVLLAELPPGGSREVPGWLSGVPCAVGPVALGLTQVPAVVRLTIEMAAAMDPATGSAVTLRQVWPRLLARRLGDEAGPLLEDAVLAGLDGVGEYERERLVEAVLTYATSGSVAETARRLYCHRNTVLNRLNRFRSLTGYDPALPDDSAVVLVALACRP
jgi:hypothetical protein